MEDLDIEIKELESATFEIDEMSDIGQDALASSCSCSCSSCCSCSTSSCCSTSTSTSSCG